MLCVAAWVWFCLSAEFVVGITQCKPTEDQVNPNPGEGLRAIASSPQHVLAQLSSQSL